MTHTLNEEQLLMLVHGYASSISLTGWIIPGAVLTMIHHYIPKSYWLKSGHAITINEQRDEITTNQRAWSTAYSTSHAILSQEHKYIWRISIISCGVFDDIRIGVSSTTAALDDEFTFSEDGHNYSYIALGKSACVGYNGTFEATQFVHYGPGDIVTIELNQNDKTVTYYKNDEFVHQQVDVHKADYRLAASMYGDVSVKIVSFHRIFINE